MHADCRAQSRCDKCSAPFASTAALTKHKRFCDAATNVVRKISNTPGAAAATAFRGNPGHLHRSSALIHHRTRYRINNNHNNRLISRNNNNGGNVSRINDDNGPREKESDTLDLRRGGHGGVGRGGNSRPLLHPFPLYNNLQINGRKYSYNNHHHHNRRMHKHSLLVNQNNLINNELNNLMPGLPAAQEEDDHTDEDIVTPVKEPEQPSVRSKLDIKALHLEMVASKLSKSTNSINKHLHSNSIPKAEISPTTFQLNNNFLHKNKVNEILNGLPSSEHHHHHQQQQQQLQLPKPPFPQTSSSALFPALYNPFVGFNPFCPQLFPTPSPHHLSPPGQGLSARGHELFTNGNGGRKRSMSGSPSNSSVFISPSHSSEEEKRSKIQGENKKNDCPLDLSVQKSHDGIVEKKIKQENIKHEENEIEFEKESPKPDLSPRRLRHHHHNHHRSSIENLRRKSIEDVRRAEAELGHDDEPDISHEESSDEVTAEHSKKLTAPQQQQQQLQHDIIVPSPLHPFPRFPHPQLHFPHHHPGFPPHPSTQFNPFFHHSALNSQPNPSLAPFGAMSSNNGNINTSSNNSSNNNAVNNTNGTSASMISRPHDLISNKFNSPPTPSSAAAAAAAALWHGNVSNR